MIRSRRLWLVLLALAVVVAAVSVATQEWRRSIARQARRTEVSARGRTRTELFTEVQPVRVANCDMKRFGEPHDGGYPLCANLLGTVTAGYSYGISGYDGWGCDVSKRLHIPVHQYDCFDLRAPSCPDGNTVFHGECVGTRRSVEDGRPFDTIANQFEHNGHTGTHLVMKIDVEGAEWDSFLLAPDSTLDQIDQLDVEFHHVDDPKYVETMRRLKQFFYVAHVHYNNFSCDAALEPFPSWAFEVLLVSKRIGASDGTVAPRGPTDVDAANNPEWPDCQATRSSAAAPARMKSLIGVRHS